MDLRSCLCLRSCWDHMDLFWLFFWLKLMLRSYWFYYRHRDLPIHIMSTATNGSWESVVTRAGDFLDFPKRETRNRFLKSERQEREDEKSQKDEKWRETRTKTIPSPGTYCGLSWCPSLSRIPLTYLLHLPKWDCSKSWQVRGLGVFWAGMTHTNFNTRIHPYTILITVRIRPKFEKVYLHPVRGYPFF